MQRTRPDVPADPVSTRPAAQEAVTSPAEPVATDFRDSEGGLFAGPASLLPEMEPASGEPPVRSLFAPRGLFRP